MAIINEDDINQKFSNKEAEEVHKEIQQIDFKELKQQAKIFLRKIDEYQKGFFHQASFQQIYQVFKEDLGKKTNQSFMQQCFYEAEILEDKLNRFLNREILFTWVTKEGTILFYDNVASREIHSNLTYSSTSNAKGKYSTPDAKKAIQKFQNRMLNEMKERVDEKAKKRAIVYTTALYRYSQKSKIKDPKNGMDYKNDESLQDTFWWRGKNWSHINWYDNGESQSKDYNKGRIAEAYAAGIINNAKNFNNLVNLQVSLKTLYQLIGSDNVAAILKGDIILRDSNDRFQFQIKSEGASSGALGQYIVMAYYIVSQEDLTPQELNKKIKKSLGKNHHTAQLILMDLFDLTTKKLLRQNWQNIDTTVWLNL